MADGFNLSETHVFDQDRNLGINQQNRRSTNKKKDYSIAPVSMQAPGEVFLRGAHHTATATRSNTFGGIFKIDSSK